MPKTSGTTLYRQDWIVAIAFWLFIAFVIGCILGGIALWQRFECSNRGDITERDHRYSVVSGCYLKSDSGRWLPADAYRDLLQ